MPRVSTVVPTYNRAEYIEGAVETVFEQTYADIEVVVVNDGSSDGTRDVLRQYENDDRVRVIHREENGGIAAARNDGVAAARGEFICILDDDDRWHPEKVAKQVRLMDALDEQYAVVYTWGENRYDGERVFHYQNNRIGDIYPEILGSYRLMPHSGHMIRRSCLDVAGEYDTDIGSADDWDMNIRLAKRYRFVCLPETLVTRIVHDRNVSLQPTHADSIRRIFEKHYKEIQQYPAIEHKLQARWRHKKAKAAIKGDDRADAIRYSLTAFRHEPSMYRAQLALIAPFGPRVYRLAQRLVGASGPGRGTGI